MILDRQDSIHGRVLFLRYINVLDDAICNTAIYADDTTLNSYYNQASDLWPQLKLASELEADLQDIVDCGRKWLVDFTAGKTQWALFDWSKHTAAVDAVFHTSCM